MNSSPSDSFHSTQSWAVLAGHLDRFIASWEKESQPPNPEDYLPTDQPIRSMVLVELLKVDLEYRIQQGQRTPVEQYGDRFPEIVEDGAPPCDLVYEEFHLRRAAGETVRSDEYFQRFPAIQEALRRLMNLDTATVTRTSAAMRTVDRVSAGETIDDFDLLIELGRGAFGQVFLARQVSMQRLVALKVSADRGDEPQTLAQMDHPGIVRVYDQRTVGDRRIRLLYMQLAPGGTLQEVVQAAKQRSLTERSGAMLLECVDAQLERLGSSPDDSSTRRWLRQATWPDAVCRLGAQLAKALHYAHGIGILHRDVKPANILLAADGSPKLADFNISFCSKLDGAAPTAYFGGSLAYMSPEQLEACNPASDSKPEDMDGRSDLFSLAVVLWELLHGDRPYPDQPSEGWSKTLARLTEQRQSTPQIPPCDELSRSVSQVLQQCLAPNREQRPECGDELARQLFLCTQSQSRRLLQGAANRWRVIIRKYSALALAIGIIAPHALAGAFNYWFNKIEVIDQIPGAAVPFERIQTVINFVAFGAAILIFGYLIYPLAKGVRKRVRGDPQSDDELAVLRQRALRLPMLAGVIGLVEWLIAGVVYPVALHLSIPELTQPQVALIYSTFLTSLFVCGLIAAAYPFFSVAYLSVHELYPALLKPSSIRGKEELGLRRVARQSAVFLLIAAGVPMAAALAVIVATSNTAAPAILIGAGIVGLAVAALTYRSLARDINALLHVVRPNEHWEGETQTATL